MSFTRTHAPFAQKHDSNAARRDLIVRHLFHISKKQIVPAGSPIYLYAITKLPVMCLTTVIYLSVSSLYLQEQRFIHKRSLHRGIPLAYNMCVQILFLWMLPSSLSGKLKMHLFVFDVCRPSDVVTQCTNNIVSIYLSFFFSFYFFLSF